MVGQLEHRGDALVGVVGLLRADESVLPGCNLAGDPESFEIGDGAAGGEVPEVAGPVQPNIAAISATASISIAELARPPSRAWLLGLIAMASA